MIINVLQLHVINFDVGSLSFLHIMIIKSTFTNCSLPTVVRLYTHSVQLIVHYLLGNSMYSLSR